LYTLDPIIVDQVDALMTGETNPVVVLSNASAMLADAMPATNWVGFYLFSSKTGTLDLGPFQGKVACTHIKPGSGVVGTAYAEDKSLIVPNVHEFAGHIACDSASNSEVVVPMTVDGQIIGILDIDSPELDRFSTKEQQTLIEFAAALAKHVDAAALSKVY
jgi:GAF domain-containing protein